MFTYNFYITDTTEIKQIMADATQQLTEAFANFRNVSSAEQQQVASAIATLVQKVDELTVKVNSGVPIEAVLAELNAAKTDVENIYNAPSTDPAPLPTPEPTPEPLPLPVDESPAPVPVDEVPAPIEPAPAEEPPAV